MLYLKELELLFIIDENRKNVKLLHAQISRLRKIS